MRRKKDTRKGKKKSPKVKETVCQKERNAEKKKPGGL